MILPKVTGTKNWPFHFVKVPGILWNTMKTYFWDYFEKFLNIYIHIPTNTEISPLNITLLKKLRSEYKLEICTNPSKNSKPDVLSSFVTQQYNIGTCYTQKFYFYQSNNSDCFEENQDENISTSGHKASDNSRIKK